MASLTLSLPSRYKDECSIAGLSGWSDGSGSSLSSSPSTASTLSLFSSTPKFINDIDVNESHKSCSNETR